jgi:hypothetical protein
MSAWGFEYGREMNRASEGGNGTIEMDDGLVLELGTLCRLVFGVDTVNQSRT